ncbi:MAG: lipopolysaccharide biosynthesis protein [Deltaproteobacteria bacterium]|nr:MAG: lipopolysaccharide biosynthesis protein [Deltaproteobacteria bacterium]
MNERTELQDIKGIFRRQKNIFLVAFLAIFILSVIIAFILPPVYRSQSTILIEEQQIPQEFVRTTITSYVEERLQVITQQIMSRPRLLEIINEFNLYPEMRDRFTTEEIVQKMRDAISFEMINTEVTDRRTGRPTTATIAFTLAYEGENPDTVQKVANKLASLYLEANLKTREQRASNITNFLEQELKNLKEKIDEKESKISQFKQLHGQELPEYRTINMQVLSRLNQQLDRIAMQIRSQQERKIYLEGQLANIDPLLPVKTEEGKTMMNPRERLKYLRLQLISLQSQLSDKHPDIKKLKGEIAELEAKVGDTNDTTAQIKQLKDSEGRLAVLKGKLGPKHPDVIKLEKEIKLLRAQIANRKSRADVATASENNPENPAYINLKTQIASAEMEIRSLNQEKKRLQEKINHYQQLIDNIPLVEKEYNDLIRDQQADQAKYQEIMNKLMEAKVSQGMEESQQAERFTIIDPALTPERPAKPNRLAIVLIGFVLALGFGVGLAAIRENLNTTVKNPAELSRSTGLPVLANVPLLETEEDIQRQKRRKIMMVGIILVIIAIGLVMINYFIMPLDILIIKLQRRFMRLI